MHSKWKHRTKLLCWIGTFVTVPTYGNMSDCQYNNCYS
jgi:hypothetical protein